MEEIIKKANELGLMLQQTAEYTNFKKSEQILISDKQSRELYETYENSLLELEQKQKMGILEQFEIEELKEMRDLIDENEIIQEYMQTKEKYINILMVIQNELNLTDY